MTGLRPYGLRCDHRTTPLGIVPAPGEAVVCEGGHPAGESPGVEFVGIGPDAAGGKTLVYRVESGGYRFFARRT